MANIWNEYSEQKRYIVTSSGISPYLETWDNSVKDVLVNIYIRLYDILIPNDFLGKEDKISELLDLYEEDARYQDIANVVIHYIAKLDLYRGITKQDIFALNIYQEIIKNKYGKKIQKCFKQLNKADRLIVCRYIAKYEISKGKEIQLDAVLKAVFQEVNIYYENSTEIIRIYVNRENNAYNTNLYKLICYFFKDIDINIVVYWQNEHFGVIEVEDTMKINSMILI